jgi:hypothetical protein
MMVYASGLLRGRCILALHLLLLASDATVQNSTQRPWNQHNLHHIPGSSDKLLYMAPEPIKH